MTDRYEHPHALRRALEDRLKTHARASGLPLDRLRKEAAFERLPARFVIAAPQGSWALKGGLAMLARVGNHARTTADADTAWRADSRGIAGPPWRGPRAWICQITSSS